MTDLQIGLIGLGAAAVVGVLAYNKWQEMRHRKVAEQVLRSEHEDVLLGRAEAAPPENPVEEDDEPLEPVFTPEERREPVLAMPEEEVTDVPPWEEPVPVAVDTVETFAPEPMYIEELPATVVPPAALPPQESAPTATVQDDPNPPPAGDVPVVLLDPRVDFIVVMELVEAVPAEQILYSQREALQRLNKPVLWVGFNERQREWEVIPPGSDRAYRRLRIGLQLADRRGPLSDADFTIFVAAMQQLADELMAVADMSPRQSVIDQAIALDRFCADVDLEIGVHLVSRGTPFSGTKIRALAEAAGMVLTAEGVFARHDDDGRVQFRLQNFESTPFLPDTIKNVTTHGLTFLLDVPRVDHGERVFFQMVDNARRFADALQGQLVDDNRQPLNEAQLDRIKREYVVKPQASMARFGFAAGSPQALRVFS